MAYQSKVDKLKQLKYYVKEKIKKLILRFLLSCYMNLVVILIIDYTGYYILNPPEVHSENITEGELPK